MKTKKIDEKIFQIQKRVKGFIYNKSYDIESLHEIRTSTREVLSLLNDKELKCFDLKQILKLSNKMRDIDVLTSQYLIKLPKKYKSEINLPILKNILKSEREKNNKIFVKFLKEFGAIDIKFSKTSGIVKPMKESDLIYDVLQLHKYRIFIKKKLYIAKNEKIRDEENIEFLTNIKNMLGLINDNHNALVIIKNANLKNTNIIKLEKYTHKVNYKYFKKVYKCTKKLP